MKLKISSSYTGVINTGSYENSRPGFMAEVELECPEGADSSVVIKKQQEAMYDICYNNFKKCEEVAILERIEKERKDFRFYFDDNGKKVPSVTSIIGFDADMYCKPEELQQYASQSNIAHAQVAHFITTGKWATPKELDELWADIVLVSKGSLQLPLGGWSFPDFLEKYPMKDLKNAESSINVEHQYGGTPDFIGVPDFKDAEPIKTLCDVKRTADKVKNFKQMAAYIKMRGYTDIKQMMIVVLNNKTKQGFSKPIVETRIDQYFKMFLRDRENFRKRYQI